MERGPPHGRVCLPRALHDRGEKTLLGQKIAAGGGQGGRRADDLPSRAPPSTARHLATKWPGGSSRTTAGLPGDLSRRLSGGPATCGRPCAPSSPAASSTPRRRIVRSQVALTSCRVHFTRGREERPTEAVRPAGQAKLREPLYLCSRRPGTATWRRTGFSRGTWVRRMNFAADAGAGKVPGVRWTGRLARSASLAKLSGPCSRRALGGEPQGRSPRSSARTSHPAAADSCSGVEFQKVMKIGLRISDCDVDLSAESRSLPWDVAQRPFSFWPRRAAA